MQSVNTVHVLAKVIDFLKMKAKLCCFHKNDSFSIKSTLNIIAGYNVVIVNMCISIALYQVDIKSNALLNMDHVHITVGYCHYAVL